MLFITSTRERALVARVAIESLGITVCLSMGGLSAKNNLSQWDFQEPEVVVGTVGRISELSPKSDYWTNLKYLIIDDAEHISGEQKTQLDELLPLFSLDKQVTVLTSGGDFELPGVTFESESTDFFVEKKAPEILKAGNMLEVVSQMFHFISQNLSKKNIIYFPNEFLLLSTLEIFKQNEVYSRWLVPNDATKKRLAFFHEFQSEPNGILMSTTELPYQADNVISLCAAPFDGVTHQFVVGESGDSKVKQLKIPTSETSPLAYGFLVMNSREDCFDRFVANCKSLGVDNKTFASFVEKGDYLKFFKYMNADLVKKLQNANFIRQ